MQQKGKITNWNDDKGFGFITPIGGGKQIFIIFLFIDVDIPYAGIFITDDIIKIKLA